MSNKKISEFPELEAIDVTNDDVMPIVNEATNKKFSWANIKTALSSIFLQKSSNLSDVANTTTARNNILPSKTGNALKVLRVNSGETDYELAASSAIVNWGDIGGTLSSQTDLNSALAAKAPTASPTFTGTVTTPALNISTSQTQKFFFASPNGSSGTPSFRAILPSDIPTLNQNTTGTASSAGVLSPGRNIDGQFFNGDSNITVIAPGTHAASSKLTLGEGDEFPLADSAASYVLKKIHWGAVIDNLIDDQIDNGVINKAPSQNAVYDALLLKLDKASFIGLTYAISRGNILM